MRGRKPNCLSQKKAMEENKKSLCFYPSMSSAMSLLLLYQQSGSAKLGHRRGEDLKMRESEQGSA